MLNPAKKEQLVRCTVNKEGVFKNFGICEQTASMFSKSEEDIITVKISIADDQTVYDQKDTLAINDYWAWFDNKENQFSDLLIYPQFFLLDMCFPAGLKKTAESGKGMYYRVNVETM